ncbi:MAG: hypothetical protein JHC88_15165 [Niveispirillum sp.]|nr:hypothetical protein [Niveispirillum sp.]
MLSGVIGVARARRGDDLSSFTSSVGSLAAIAGAEGSAGAIGGATACGIGTTGIGAG